jgi:hypothetical protein
VREFLDSPAVPYCIEMELVSLTTCKDPEEIQLAVVPVYRETSLFPLLHDGMECSVVLLYLYIYIIHKDDSWVVD